jgi:hypothetical protein
MALDPAATTTVWGEGVGKRLGPCAGSGGARSARRCSSTWSSGRAAAQQGPRSGLVRRVRPSAGDDTGRRCVAAVAWPSRPQPPPARTGRAAPLARSPWRPSALARTGTAGPRALFLQGAAGSMVEPRARRKGAPAAAGAGRSLLAPPPGGCAAPRSARLRGSARHASRRLGAPRSMAAARKALGDGGFSAGTLPGDGGYRAVRVENPSRPI